MPPRKKSLPASHALTHLRADGTAHMVDVSAKDITVRTATATAQLRMARATYRVLVDGKAPKGDALGVARLAGIQGAKRTADIIPLCHPLPLTHVSVDLVPDARLPGVRLSATVRTVGRTGVEMEALTAVTCAGLALYDMLKAVDRAMVLSEVSVAMKDGGRSGRYVRGTQLEGGGS
jgi:cyclic pyranopterin phosphate synthase